MCSFFRTVSADQVFYVLILKVDIKIEIFKIAIQKLPHNCTLCNIQFDISFLSLPKFLDNGDWKHGILCPSSLALQIPVS